MPGQSRKIAPGWRRERGEPSLADVYRSIPVRSAAPSWRQAMVFIGPGYLVAVGYMDPGNWATSLAGGSKFGYSLLAVAFLSNVMAIMLQALSARLAIGAERDLAQACRDAFPKPLALSLWFLAEIAIIATDLAEVIGTAIGLNLLFGIPLEIGIFTTALDVFLILYLQRLGFRWIEGLIISLLCITALCFAIQIAFADPDWGAIIRGFVPTPQIMTDPGMLYLALSILGATVMPHNLYLHAGIVQTRGYGEKIADKRQALKYATIDSTIALMMALLVNASILILAAATFNHAGRQDIAELGEAHRLLEPLLGMPIAPTLFGIALLCCGINSSVTATLAGQIVMEGFLEIRLSPALRRLITRAIAIVPAAMVAIWFGDGGTARLLIMTQVILSFQLSFAVFPLVMFTAEKAKLGALVAPRWLTAFAGLIAIVIAGFNIKLLIDFVIGTR
ncbi:MAG TPA: Nramp family divalent metal transporter [Hyphomicrobiales bacterium]